MDSELKIRCARAREIPDRFGEGWMSKSARDMVRIAAFAGFDIAALTLVLAKLNLKKVQERHVIAAMERQFHQPTLEK